MTLRVASDFDDAIILIAPPAFEVCFVREDARVSGYTCPPEHSHAEKTTCYTAHGCKCDPCRVANNARARDRRRQIAYGRWTRGMVPVADVVGHIRHLQDFGYSYDHIAAAAGVNARSLYMASTGRLTSVQGRVAGAVLAVHPTLDDLGPRTLIPSRGARRRIQALGTQGWSIAAVAARADLTRDRLSHFIWFDHIQVHRHRQIAAVYEQLWDAPPPSTTPADRRSITLTKNRAAAEGWASPLAWDDIDNDTAPDQPQHDPDLVDVVAIDLATEGHQVRLTRAERLIATEQLTNRGYSLSQIATLLCVSDQTILRDRRYLRDRAAADDTTELEDALAA